MCLCQWREGWQASRGRPGGAGGAHQQQQQQRQHLVHVADAMTSDGTLPAEQIHTAGARTGGEQGGGGV